MSSAAVDLGDERSVRRAARTDARVQRRRRQILDAATEVMSQTGFHSTSMQSVAEQAGISVGLIYQYFANKDVLLEAVIVDILEDFRDQVPAAILAAGADPGRPVQGRVRHLLPGGGREATRRQPHLPGKSHALPWRAGAHPATRAADRRADRRGGRRRRRRWRVRRYRCAPRGAQPVAGVSRLGAQTLEPGRFVTLDEYVDRQFVLLLDGIRASSSA